MSKLHRLHRGVTSRAFIRASVFRAGFSARFLRSLWTVGLRQPGKHDASHKFHTARGFGNSQIRHSSTDSLNGNAGLMLRLRARKRPAKSRPSQERMPERQIYAASANLIVQVKNALREECSCQRQDIVLPGAWTGSIMSAKSHEIPDASGFRTLQEISGRRRAGRREKSRTVPISRIDREAH